MPEENKCPQCGTPLKPGALAGLCPACLLKAGATADTGTASPVPPFQPPAVTEIAALFPQLEVLELIGKGGMGAVYKARQRELDRLVALKILPPGVGGDAAFAERFSREARALAKLNHPNIVAVHEFGEVKELPFFIMEFVDGLNLRQLERAGKLSPREALKIVPQICEALQFAHDEGIVHRDIKPENILVDKKGRVKIADFGIAKIIGRERPADQAETQDAIGTPHYMAPEQVEKPQAVDHRADIFALGVVFYEMLTGELPLGKFAPPSRRVQVDVRLDDVVLRTLEKEPERRYQQASQVKTAVETIVNTSGSAQAQAANEAASFAQKTLATDYRLSISSCVGRGWTLVRNDFWPLIGVSALIGLLLALANAFPAVVVGEKGSSAGGILGLLLGGPLQGGLCLYYLRKIRRQMATVETAFAGFSPRFLHLFLGGLVSTLLMFAGFFCFILPGIYVWVAWSFTLPLIIDRGLDFWPAMELSRKMISKHWWKFFAFCLVLVLVHFAGILALCIGYFIAAPIALAAMMYAYEDIMGGDQAVASQPSPVVGPTGTKVVGEMPTPGASGRAWKPAAWIGTALALVLLVFLAVLAITNLLKRSRVARFEQRQVEVARRSTEMLQRQMARSSRPVFGPVTEQIIQARATGTNQFLDLDTGQLLTPPPEIASALDSETGEDTRRFWQGLDIPEGSRRFQYVAWLRESGADLMFSGDGKIIGFDGIFPMAHGNNSANWENWDSLRPNQVDEAINVVEWSRRATTAARNHQPIPPGPKTGGIVSSAAQLDSQSGGGPLVNLLTRDQSVLWYFKTREGAKGVLQIEEFSVDPPGARIRYKLVSGGPAGHGASVAAKNDAVSTEAQDDLESRVEAATLIMNINDKDRMLAKLAEEAAEAGEVKIVVRTLGQMNNIAERDGASIGSVRALAKRGLKKDALEIAKGIMSLEVRDQALAELADGVRGVKNSD